MPLEIPAQSKAGEVVSPLATATDEVQKRRDVSGDSELADLRTYLSARNKGGTLAIRTRWDGTKEMYRMQWYHRLWFCRSEAAQQKEAAEYVLKILSSSKAEQSSDKSSTPVISKALARFLNPSSLKYEELSLLIACPEKAASSRTTGSLLQPQQIVGTEDLNQGQAPHKLIIRSFLSRQGITVRSQMGGGGQADIHSISYRGNGSDYLYKELDEPVQINDPKDLLRGHRFDRIGGDIAAAQCRLPNVVESVGFFLKVVKNPLEVRKSFATPVVDYHYLPNTNPEEVRKYAEMLGEAHPGAEIFLCGQIMKRAPGKNLKELIEVGQNNSEMTPLDTNPKQKPFQNIVYGLYSFLKAARDRHFIHRDIKPENLMFDQTTGQLTVIDTTSGRDLASTSLADQAKSTEGSSGKVLGSRDTDEETERETSSLSSSNSIASRQNTSTVPLRLRPTMTGSEGTTFAYAYPSAIFRVSEIKDDSGTVVGFHAKEYGVEFDCFSTAMTLLELLDKAEFYRYRTQKFQTKFSEQNDSELLADQWGDNPKEYLDKYLSWIKDEKSGTSETFKILEANSDLKRCLELLFEASAPGEAGEEAFAQLATDPYMQECGRASQEARAVATA